MPFRNVCKFRLPQVDDERLVRDLLKEERGRGVHGRQMGGAGPRDRWGDIYANAPVKKMIALYDYDPQELSPNVDAEVELVIVFNLLFAICKSFFDNYNLRENFS